MGWLIRGSGEGQGRRTAAVAGLAFVLGLGACVIDPPQPPFELSPTTDQVGQVLRTRFAAARDPSGAPCSDDFALTGVAVREWPQTYMTTHRSYGMEVDVAYTATLQKPAANLTALTDACFGPGTADPAAWMAGQSQSVLLGAQMSWAATGWTLAVGAANASTPATFPLANAAAPHAYKMGSNGRLPR
jgi:hypothetical protein